MQWSLKKRIVAVSAILIALCFFGYGCNSLREHGSPLLGGEREETIPIPTSLEGAQIVFMKPMQYQIGTPQEKIDTLQAVHREIVGSNLSSGYDPARFTNEPVASGTKFSIVNAIRVTPYGLFAIDSTWNEEYLILQDENGLRSFILQKNFTTSSSQGGELADDHVADYYRNGQRIGTVRF